jgi:quinoprotein glucose dehydrogenase
VDVADAAVPDEAAAVRPQGVSIDDLIDFTPELRAEAIEGVKKFRLGPIFTPPSLAKAADGTSGTLTLPNATGGRELGRRRLRSREERALRRLGHESVGLRTRGAAGGDGHYVHRGRRCAAAVAARLAANQAAVWAHHGVRYEQGRDPLAKSQRADAEGDRRESRAQGARHPADRKRGASAHAGDEDAALHG